MFGVMDISSGFQGCRFAIGLRNSHDKSFRLSCTVGLRVFVCENLAFHGDYKPVGAEHSRFVPVQDSLVIVANSEFSRYKDGTRSTGALVFLKGSNGTCRATAAR